VENTNKVNPMAKNWLQKVMVVVVIAVVSVAVGMSSTSANMPHLYLQKYITAYGTKTYSKIKMKH
jgi:hypothetical protein